jgi:integrase
MAETYLSVEKYLVSQRFSANTVRNYRRVLNLLLSEVDTKALGALGFRRWLDNHGWSSASKWLAYCAAVGFLRWLHGANHPALDLRIRRDPSPPQKAYRLPEIQKLLASFDTLSVKGRRDLALCGLLLDAGLRAAEICRLSLGYLDLDSRSLQVVVKGNHWTWRGFSRYVATWLGAWLSDRSSLAGAGVDAVFVSLGGRSPGQAMTPGGLAAEVDRWGAAAGIGHLTPHMLRRSMASTATVLGAPEDVVMKGGGWRSSEVLRRYTTGVKPSDMEPYYPTRAAMESLSGS